MIGLANNGDFGRMIEWGALNYVETRSDDIFFHRVNREYKFVANPITTEGYWLSSEIVFVKVAAALCYWFFSDQSFDLRMAEENFRGAERIYAWSFYSQGTSDERAASADLFIDEALRWFGDPAPTTGWPWDKGERLADLIRRSRKPLVLDGLELLRHPLGRNAGSVHE